MIGPEPMIRLDALQVAAIAAGAGAAAHLGLGSARAAAAADHPLWTAALLMHEIAGNPLWRMGQHRPAGAVETALGAARRLIDAAFAALVVEVRDAGVDPLT